MLSGNAEHLLKNLKDIPQKTSEPESLSAKSTLIDQKIPVLRCADEETSSDITHNIHDISFESCPENTEEQLREVINEYEEENMNELDSETNVKLIDYVISSTYRHDNGSLVMPIIWNSKIKHLLPQNFNLSFKILESNFKKLQQSPEKLKLYDDVFKEQEKLGIIEKVENVRDFIKIHPEASFMPHMGVFKMQRETTKCRVVFLSNLCETSKINPISV